MGFLSTSGLLAACGSGVETCEVKKSTGKPKKIVPGNLRFETLNDREQLPGQHIKLYV
jgi:hypothetical protein